MVQTGVERTEGTLDEALADLAAAGPAAGVPSPAGHGPDPPTALAVFRAMLTSRALDVAARELKAAGRGYYTISSAGHEYDAVVGHQLRTTDPAFLHYRSGAFVAARRRDDPDRFVRDTVASLSASTSDPVSAGRHKVWGDRETWIPPQTSTIASHLPKAVGTAIALGRADREAFPDTPATRELGPDPIVCATFGDASVNHAAASAAFSMARWARRQGARVPILFVCEDNGLGISVPTPRRWVAQTLSALPGITYVHADGDLAERWVATAAAIERVRGERAPVALHLPTVRLWGHAGSDVEVGYRSRQQVAADEARDPLVEAARWLVATGTSTGQQLQALREDVRALVRRAADEVEVRHAASADEVAGPLALQVGSDVREGANGARDVVATRAREVAWTSSGSGLPEEAVPPLRRTLGARLNQGLHDLLADHPRTVVFGEDVAVKGGVYGTTAGLQARFGTDRVFDTMLDETAILGAAQGFGLLGYLPVPEIQYLAYLHNALDQLRGEACSTAWLSDDAFRTPMVVRVASFAHQGGFGGHFHNDDAIGALRDIPGLLLAAPARGDDAVRLLRGAAALASRAGRVVAFLEPIALYHQRDLYEDGDDGWLTDYPVTGGLLPGEVAVHPAGRARLASATIGQARTAVAPQPVELVEGDPWVHLDDGADLVVVTYANGVPMALRAARRLQVEEGVRARVMDVRWLQPLPMEAIAAQARDVGRVLVLDECRATGGGIADAVVAGLVEGGSKAALASVRARDSYVPLGPAASHVLVGEDEVVEVAARLARNAPRR